jgi:hypothetical protein
VIQIDQPVFVVNILDFNLALIFLDDFCNLLLGKEQLIADAGTG